MIHSTTQVKHAVRVYRVASHTIVIATMSSLYTTSWTFVPSRWMLCHETPHDLYRTVQGPRSSNVLAQVLPRKWSLQILHSPPIRETKRACKSKPANRYPSIPANTHSLTPPPHTLPLLCRAAGPSRRRMSLDDVLVGPCQDRLVYVVHADGVGNNPEQMCAQTPVERWHSLFSPDEPGKREKTKPR
jgi:hypothetical protein